MTSLSYVFIMKLLWKQVRDTSHKPDEIYGIIERLSPGTRKLELFGRMHNIQPNWFVHLAFVTSPIDLVFQGDSRQPIRWCPLG